MQYPLLSRLARRRYALLVGLCLEETTEVSDTPELAMEDTIANITLCLIVVVPYYGKWVVVAADARPCEE